MSPIGLSLISAVLLTAGEPGAGARLLADAGLVESGQDAEASFQEGLRLLDLGRFREAAVAFARARRTGDLSAALLQGVCLYRLGDDVEAATALREAEQASEHREVARLYLGLLALRAGQTTRAAELFDAAAASPSLATMAGTLARMAHRDGPLVLGLSLQSGFDSNVALAPGHPAGDGLYDLAASALWRPEGPVGPYLRGAAALHRYFQQDAYDLATVDAGAGWQLGRDGDGLVGELGGRLQRFGPDPYLQSARTTVSGWLTSGDVTWSATWWGALQRYATAFDAFTGTLQRLEGRAAWTFGPRAWLAVAYGGTLDTARATVAGYVDHGPRLELRAVLADRWRAGLDGALTWRRYGAFDPALGVRQTATFLAGAGFVEHDLGDHWTVRLAVEGRNAASNVAASSYTKVVPVAGLTYTGGP